MDSKKGNLIRNGTTVVLLFLMTISSGCYHYHINAPHTGPATERKSQVVHGLFWGLVQKPAVGIKTDNCVKEDQGIYDVRVNNNLGFSLITVVTLGIWSPMKIEWQCAKPCPQEGEIK